MKYKLVILMSFMSLWSINGWSKQGGIKYFGKIVPYGLNLQVNPLDVTPLLEQQPPQEIPVLEPVRMARFNVKFYKIKVIIKDGIAIGIEAERACSGTAEAPVYDGRGLDGFGLQVDGLGTCEAQLYGKSVSLSYYGFMFFSDFDRNDELAFISSFGYSDSTEQGAIEVLRGSNGYFRTKRVSLDQGSFSLTPDGIWSPTGEVNATEYFRADIEMVDSNR